MKATGYLRHPQEKLLGWGNKFENFVNVKAVASLSNSVGQLFLYVGFNLNLWKWITFGKM